MFFYDFQHEGFSDGKAVFTAFVHRASVRDQKFASLLTLHATCGKLIKGRNPDQGAQRALFWGALKVHR